MLFLTALLALLITGIVFGVFWMIWGSGTNPEVVRERMAAVHRAERLGRGVTDLQLVRDDMMSSVPLLNRIMTHLTWTAKLQDAVTQAGMTTKPGKILLFCGVSGLSVYLVAGLFYGQFIVGLIAALAGASCSDAGGLYQTQSKIKSIRAALSRSIGFAGTCRACGHAFISGLEMVSKESPEPVATEFRTAFEEQNFGLPLRDALSNWLPVFLWSMCNSLLRLS